MGVRVEARRQTTRHRSTSVRARKAGSLVVVEKWQEAGGLKRLDQQDLVAECGWVLTVWVGGWEEADSEGKRYQG